MVFNYHFVVVVVVVVALIGTVAQGCFKLKPKKQHQLKNQSGDMVAQQHHTEDIYDHVWLLR